GGVRGVAVPVRGRGVDTAAYLTGTLRVTKDPDSGSQNMGPYRAALKARERLAGRMVARVGGAGGYVHWLKHNERKTEMPIAIVVGAAPVVMFTGPQKLAIDLDEMGVAGALAGEPIRMTKCKTIDLDVPADAEIVIEGLIDTSVLGPEAPFGESNGYVGVEGDNMPVRGGKGQGGAGGKHKADAGAGDPQQEDPGFLLDHQPGAAERIEPGQARRLRAALARASQGASRRPRRAPRRDARAAHQSAAGDLRAVRLRHGAHRGVARPAGRVDADAELRQDLHRGERGHRSRQHRRDLLVARLPLQPARGRARGAVPRRCAGLAVPRERRRLHAADRRDCQGPDAPAGAAEAGVHAARRGAVGRAEAAADHAEGAVARLHA